MAAFLCPFPGDGRLIGFRFRLRLPVPGQKSFIGHVTLGGVALSATMDLISFRVIAALVLVFCDRMYDRRPRLLFEYSETLF